MVSGLAYLERESFALLLEYPWSITQGNVEANIASIPGDVPDATARKFYIMQRCASVSRFALTNTVDSWKEAPCSTGCCEKAHGMGSLLMEGHAQYGSRTLALRSVVCQARPIFQLSSEAKRREKLEEELEALTKKAHSTHRSKRVLFPTHWQ